MTGRWLPYMFMRVDVFSHSFRRNLLYKQAPKLVWIVASRCGLFVLWACYFPDISYRQKPLTFWWKLDNNVYSINSCQELYYAFPESSKGFYMHHFINMPGFFIYKMLLRRTRKTIAATCYWTTRCQVLGKAPGTDYLYNSHAELVFLVTFHRQGN